jgi:hypothetical protein
MGWTVPTQQGAAQDKSPTGRNRRNTLYLAEMFGSDNFLKLAFVYAGRHQTLTYNVTLDKGEKVHG